jgi:choline dehydrogenase-like flavoprotein
LGELNHFNNIFILDASILPDMPGSPTTLNVCINAQRIIKELSKENRI